MAEDLHYNIDVQFGGLGKTHFHFSDSFSSSVNPRTKLHPQKSSVIIRIFVHHFNRKVKRH